MQKTSIPKGTRDFSPHEMARRNYIFDTIKQVYRLYGFEQIETPAMENLSTLMGKYGDEGDKLLFKILNSGDYLANADANAVEAHDSMKLLRSISEKGLRYDLTVPFARYVVQHNADITLPFKRYQIQPVWRADRPQKGRYREFYQCDADIVGSDSLLQEAELISILRDVFHRLKINVTLHLNNRKILTGIADVAGAADHLTDITVAIDKLDKIGLENVKSEMREKGVDDDAIAKLQPILELQGSNDEKLKQLRKIFDGKSEAGVKGVEETVNILSMLRLDDTEAFSLTLDLTLARGLNYYTGAIMEVKANDVAMGSISGGGRYDNLTGVFGLPGLSGVGISFGADRIYDVLTTLDLFPASTAESTNLLFACFGDEELRYAFRMAETTRGANIATEIYPSPVKMKKQLAYADAKHIPFVAIVGSDEMADNTAMLKNMTTGEQQKMAIDDIVKTIQNHF